MPVSIPMLVGPSFYAFQASALTTPHISYAQSHPDYTLKVVTFINFSHYTENMAMKSVNQVPFDSPAPYRIQVQGPVALSWSDRLQGMDIYQSTSKTGAVVSTLTGELPDQTALAGVLITLHDMHLSVLSVECLKPL